MVLFLPLFLFHINNPTIPKPRRQTTMTTGTTITSVEAKTKVCSFFYILLSAFNVQ